MLSIYKPDQGYWTRLLSALGFGALIAWGAMYVWAQLGAVDIPKVGYTFSLDPPAPALTAGQTVDLYRDGIENPVGTASIVSVEEDGARVVADTFTFEGDSTVLSVAELAPSGSSSFEAIEIVTKQGIDAFPQIYLQGGVAIGIIVLGAVVLLYFCYASRKTVDFLIATEGEMKKVNWSSRREVLGSTWVVIAISLIIAAILLVADISFASFFRAINLLES